MLLFYHHHQAWLLTLMLRWYLLILCLFYGREKGNGGWLTHLTTLEETGGKVKPSITIKRITFALHFTKIAHYLCERCARIQLQQALFPRDAKWTMPPGVTQWWNLGLHPIPNLELPLCFFLIVSCLEIHCPCTCSILKLWTEAGSKVHTLKKHPMGTLNRNRFKVNKVSDLNIYIYIKLYMTYMYNYIIHFYILYILDPSFVLFLKNF